MLMVIPGLQDAMHARVLVAQPDAVKYVKNTHVMCIEYLVYYIL